VSVGAKATEARRSASVNDWVSHSSGRLPTIFGVIKKQLKLSSFAQLVRLNTAITKVGDNTERENLFITGREQMLESPLQRCVVNVGISLLCDWDVFAFVYRHVSSLATVDQIARLVGYESGVVRGALDRLEGQKLIERSRLSRGVRLYRVLSLKDVEHRRCLQKLVALSESRAGRLELARLLSPIRSCRVDGDAFVRNPGPEGKGLCLKA
jgi:DNA-binding MarR family transcriptional regulator